MIHCDDGHDDGSPSRTRRVPARPRDAVAPDRSAYPAVRPGAARPGLRREEVAMLAGVSLTWYTWLEQGRRINASPDVLSAIGRALKLDEAGIDHLLGLAQPSPTPVDAPQEAPSALCD